MTMLLNHTTTIPLAKTLLELGQAVPVPVTFEHDHGRVTAVTFRYAGELYRLSPNVEGAWKLLNQSKGLGEGPKRTYEHAERVAWRCVLSWVKAELALVAMDMAVPRTRGFEKDSRRLRAWSASRSGRCSIGGSGWNRGTLRIATINNKKAEA